MRDEQETKLRLEIAHVLFIDIVDYSKLLINEQSQLQRELGEIASNTNQFREATAEGKLIRLPTGDGMALVFRNNLEAPVQCALEIARVLKNYPNLPVRMGIHSGPINEVADVNQRANIAGAGINVAQRVMDCGDAGHILVSKHVAEDLEHYEHWRPLVHHLGSCDVKHGARLDIVNLYSNEVGNPEPPKKFQALRRRRSRTRWIATAAGLLFLAVIAAAFLVLKRPTRSTFIISQKSVAVLPFENLSRDPDNAYLAAGIQDEIITRLTKIAELKVVSCLSGPRLKNSPDDLSAVGRQLGVANLLQGTVQRSSDQLRVNVKLIKAESESSLWAESFDRQLTDVFQIETEIAKMVASILQAKLTGIEQNAIAIEPTHNTEAHQLYMQGRYLWNRRTVENLKKALIYFEQAAERDPNYALAYAGIADTCSVIPTFAAGAPQDYLPRARAAAEKALALDGSLAEAHASLGLALFYYFDSYRSAKEFERAIELNPNYATAHHWYGRLTLCMLGQFDRAITELKRAVELDPVSPIIQVDLGTVHLIARRYDEAIAQYRKTLEMNPEFYWAHRVLGWALELKGEFKEAIAEYQRALLISDDPAVLALLAHAEASIGKLENTRQALVRLEEASKTRYVSPYSFAVVHIALGEKERAIECLEKAAHEHAGTYINHIKFDPYFEALHGDPRFEQIVALVAPKL